MVVPDDVLADHAGLDQFQVTIPQPYGARRQRTAFEDDAISEVAVSFDLNGGGLGQ